MKRKLFLLLIAFALCFSGCSIYDGQYVRVTPHVMQLQSSAPETYTAASNSQLREILESMVESGNEKAVIYMDGFDFSVLSKTLDITAQFIKSNNPVGAYAVDEISFQIGTNSGKTAVALDISYRINPADIRQIPHAYDMKMAADMILRAMENCEARTVLKIDAYETTDLTQLVKDISLSNPQTVMEIPQITEACYGVGDTRVIEITFAYETSRDSLRQMQAQVRPIFDSAALYVSGEGSDLQKYSQLYAFLMERFDYTLETSITPTYSLLRHGVGDSRAFATVYAAMCRKAGLDCQAVTGTRQGEPWTWNLICDEGVYYHVDLLSCAETGTFQEHLDTEMIGYVWDYSAYPDFSERG